MLIKSAEELEKEAIINTPTPSHHSQHIYPHHTTPIHTHTLLPLPPVQGTVLIKSAEELENYSRTEEARIEELIRGIAGARGAERERERECVLCGWVDGWGGGGACGGVLFLTKRHAPWSSARHRGCDRGCGCVCVWWWWWEVWARLFAFCLYYLPAGII